MARKKSVWQYGFQKVVSFMVNLIAKEKNHNVNNTVLIVGSTRSGTTYLMENINTENDYRLIFEPFNNTYVDEWKHFDTRHFIDPNQPTEIEKQAIQRILSGRIKNKWTDQFNRKINPDKRLIKAVRANLLVEYIRTLYPKLQIIYLIRNPYEVVASRINMNFDPRDVDTLLANTDFINRHYSDIKLDQIHPSIDTKEAKHAALWCLENRHLYRQISELNLNILSYDNIKGKSIKLNGSEIKLSQKQSKPSASSSRKEPYELSESERENIRNILVLFGMEDRETHK